MNGRSIKVATVLCKIVVRSNVNDPWKIVVQANANDPWSISR